MLARRTGGRCSNPHCRTITTGPQVDPRKAIDIGVAAHITAASPKGPRFSSKLNSDERRAIENGIWLCQTCAKVADSDPGRYPPELLHQWKVDAEAQAASELKLHREYREILSSEFISELDHAEYLAHVVIERELGCRLTINVRVETSDGGWLRLDAAAVHGDALVGVAVHVNDGRGIRLFQVEHLIELGNRLRFKNFDAFELWVVVVSTASEAQDEEVLAKLNELAAKAAFGLLIRSLRLSDLAVGNSVPR